MRLALVVAASLLLSGCSWVQKEIGSAPPPAVAKPEPAPAAPTPAPRPVHRPHARTSVPSPVAQSPQAPQPATLPEAAPPVPAPPPNYDARCHAMAANRANDARQLGASAGDQAQVEGDTYRDCMAQSVK